MPDVSDKLIRGFGSPGQKRNRFADADQKLAELERDERRDENPPPAAPAPTPVRQSGKRSYVKRDIISMPEDEYELIEQIRARCLDERVVVGKSEAVRIALRAAAALSSTDLAAYAATLTKVKPGKRSTK